MFSKNITQRQWLYVIPLMFIVLNIIIKCLQISTNSIAEDEPFSIFHAQLSVIEIISNLFKGNNPPLYEIILHFWVNIFGIGALAVRVPSLIFSSVTVYFIYQIGLKNFSKRLAVVASLLYTFSNINLYYAHEARVYSLFALLTAISMFLFFNIINNRNIKQNFLALLVCNILLLYAHYFSIFVLIIQTIVIFNNKIDFKQILIKYGFYALALFVLYIPALPVVYERFVISSSQGTWLLPPDGINSLYGMLRVFSNKPIAAIFCIMVLTLGLVFWIFRKRKTDFNNNIFAIQVWFLFPFIFMFTISYWIPMFWERYLIFVSLGYYLLLAIIADSLFRNQKFNTILSVLLIVVFIITFKLNIDNKRHVKEVVNTVVGLKDEKTAVLVSPTYFAPGFTYYYDISSFQKTDSVDVHKKMYSSMVQQNIYFSNSSDIIPSLTDRVLFVDAASNFSFPNNRIFEKLSESYNVVNEVKIYEIYTIYEFIKK